jgi:hypothetical protein
MPRCWSCPSSRPVRWSGRGADHRARRGTALYRRFSPTGVGAGLAALAVTVEAPGRYCRHRGAGARGFASAMAAAGGRRAPRAVSGPSYRQTHLTRRRGHLPRTLVVRPGSRCTGARVDMRRSLIRGKGHGGQRLPGRSENGGGVAAAAAKHSTSAASMSTQHTTGHALAATANAKAAVDNAAKTTTRMRAVRYSRGGHRQPSRIASAKRGSSARNAYSIAPSRVWSSSLSTVNYRMRRTGARQPCHGTSYRTSAGTVGGVSAVVAGPSAMWYRRLAQRRYGRRPGATAGSGYPRRPRSTEDGLSTPPAVFTTTHGRPDRCAWLRR